MPKLEVVITAPSDTVALPGGGTTIVFPQMFAELLGYQDVGGHAFFRITNDNGTTQTFGLYPADPGSAGAIFGNPAIVDGRDAGLLPKREQAIASGRYTVDEMERVSHVETCSITAAQASLLVRFSSELSAAAGAGEFKYSLTNDGISCAGFVQRALAYAGVPFNFTEQDGYLGPADWAPTSLLNAFSPSPTSIPAWLLGGNANNVLVTTSGGNEASGAGGSDLLMGSVGADHLDGGDGDDWLHGGGGSDVLTGGAGNDKYVFRIGDGNDTIFTGGGLDQLISYGADATFVRDGVDVLVKLDQESVRIKDWFTLGTTDNQLDAAIVNGQHISNLAISSLALEVHGGSSDDYLTGLAGYSDVIYGEDGADSIYLAQTGGPNASDTAHGGAGDDWIWGGESNDFLYGGTGDDYLFGGGGSNTYGWAVGDGLDTIYSSSATDTFEITSVNGINALAASRSGEDLLISATGGGGGGALFKNWFSGYGQMNITLPDGTTWTPEQISEAFKPAVMGVNFPSGVAAGSSFSAVIRNQGYEFAGGDNYLSGAFGFSWLGYVWESGLASAAETGKTVNGHAVREWGSSMGYVDSTYAYSQPGFAVWSEFKYQFWENDNGSYSFSLISESAGTGGQQINGQDTDGDGWTDSYDYVQKYTRVNQNWPSTSYEVSPAVEQVDLLAGPETSSAARAMTVPPNAAANVSGDLNVYALPVGVPDLFAAQSVDTLFGAGQKTPALAAYLALQRNGVVGLAAALGEPTHFFAEDEQGQPFSGLDESGWRVREGTRVSDASLQVEGASADVNFVQVRIPTYVPVSNDFALVS